MTGRTVQGNKQLGYFTDHLGVTALGREMGRLWRNTDKIFLAKTTARYVLGADSADVLLLGDPHEALRRFLNCWPGTVSKGFQRHSGLWIAERDTARAVLAAARG